MNSFTNPHAYRANHRFRKSELPVASHGVMSREVRDVLETVEKSLGVGARRQHGVGARRQHGDAASVRLTTLRWLNSAELVAIVKTSARSAHQLHFPILAGRLFYTDDDAVESVAISTDGRGADDGDAEALVRFIEVLRRDVATILASAGFDAELAAMPVAHRAKFN